MADNKTKKPPTQPTPGPKSWFGAPSAADAIRKRKKMYDDAMKS